MKNLSTAALIVVLAALSPASINAAEPGPAAYADQTSPAAHHGDREHYRAAHVQKSLDKLQQKLHLKDNQQSAWSQYKLFIFTALSEQAKNRENHRPDQAKEGDNLSTPERLQNLADHLRERAAEIEKIGVQTEVFYKTLSAEQKTIFDLLARNHRPHRHS